MRPFTFAWMIALLLLPTVAVGQPPETQEKKSVKPGINKSFLDPDLDVDKYIGRFEVESREVFRDRKEIVKQVKLSPGQRIADIGTGTGLFVEPFSKEVGEKGWVYALDIAPKFVERVGKIAQQRGLDNVTPVLCGQDNIRLAPGSIDVAFLCDVYHHFEYPQDSLASIHRAMVPSGKLVVIDFERIPGKTREWLLRHVRAGKEVFRNEIQEAGFRFVEEVPMPSLEENYFLVFERKK